MQGGLGRRKLSVRLSVCRRGVARILHWRPQTLSVEGASIKAPTGVKIGEGVYPFPID